MINVVYRRGNIIWRERLSREAYEELKANHNYIIISASIA